VSASSSHAKSRALLVGRGEPALSLVKQALVAPAWAVRLIDPSADPAPAMAEGPDVVILDGLASGQPMLELLPRLRELDARFSTPLVLLLGADAPEVVTAAYAAGVSDVLVAPVGPAALADRVSFQLRSAQLVGTVRSQVQELLHAQRLGGTGSWTLASFSGLMHWTPEAERLLGLAVGSGPRSLDAFLRLVPEDEREALRRTLDHCAEKGRPVAARHRLTLEGGGERWLEQSVEPIRSYRRTVGLRGTLREITAQRESEQEQRRRGSHDPLTKLPSRSLLVVRLREAMDDARKDGLHVALLHVSLDRFRNVNQTLGHDFGDRILQHVAKVLVRVAESAGGTREEVARLAGDEFAVIVPRLAEPEEASEVARRLLDALAVPERVGNQEVRISASVGIAVHPDDGASADALLQHADLAALHAKRVGHGRLQPFRRAMGKAAARRFTLEAELRGALDRGELHVAYQPRVAASDGRIVGVEALIRWDHPVLGRVSPREFIPIAEETGLVGALGSFVLASACRDAKQLEQRGQPLSVSVNVSSWQFANTNVWEAVTAALRESGLPPERLELEITESLVLEGSNDPDVAFRDLRGIGVRIALDDFGTGYSSLSYVSRFPLDVLKIDRSIVREVDSDPAAERVARAVVGLAHSLDMRVVAEGVDAEAQAEVLRRIGCDELQGFSICESVRLEELVELLERDAFGQKTQLGVVALQPASRPDPEDGERTGEKRIGEKRSGDGL
jgi:diguanylate cyclase (GGDEF)-like protein/PAS domain S-box-containing protein